jgi:hypothetical protein
MKDFLPEWVPFAVEDVFPSHPFGGKVKASYA